MSNQEDDFLNALRYQQQLVLQAMGVSGMTFRPPDLVTPVRPLQLPRHHKRVIPGGPMVREDRHERLAAEAEQVTTIGTCKGCGTDAILDGYRLCTYCGELAGLQARLSIPNNEQESPWPWPLSVRGFLVRFWLVAALMILGFILGAVA